MSFAFKPRPVRFLPLAILALTLIVACGPGSPEEAVTQTRGQYAVQLSAWFPKVVEEPVVEPTEETAEGTEEEAGEPVAEPVAEEAAAEGTEGEEGEPAAEEAAEPVAAEPTQTTIVFDLLVIFSGDKALDGITVDVTQAGADGAEKKAWRHFLEMPGIVKGDAKQIGFEADVELAEGDQFSVQLLKNVDPAQYGEYKEYASAGQ